MKAIGTSRLLLVLSFCLLGLATSSAQDDWHITASGARTFFLRSTFAHGYMHGYEEGFHEGDMDLQMGRPFHQAKKQSDFKKVCGYRSEFGDRKDFQAGYQKGYAVGYTDSYVGRSFRAMQLVELAKSENLPDSAAVPDRRFDQAFSAGYDLGQKSGLKDGRSSVPADSLDSIICAVAGHGPDACAAYRRGYRLGYSDGYTNQIRPPEVVARK